MRLNSRLLSLVAILFASSSLFAQVSTKPGIYHFHDPALLARFSYDNSAITQIDGSGHICMAVFRDGAYRVLRTMDGKNQYLQGKMSSEKLEQLKALLVSPQFRDMSGYRGGLIRKESESFGAEISMPGWKREEDARTFRLQWINGDGENPFPAAMGKVVDWLQDFEPTGGRQFDPNEFPNVCPSVGLRMLHPLTVSLR